MKNHRTTPRIETRSKREGGVALMLSILLLITVSGLAISTMQTAASDGTVAGFQKQEMEAFYAAEAAIADARRSVRSVGERDEIPSFPDQANPRQLATSADFPYGQQPVYFSDPHPLIPTPIGYIGEGEPCNEGCNIAIGGLLFNHTRWKINVVGQSSSGDQQRLEVVATRLLSAGGY